MTSPAIATVVFPARDFEAGVAAVTNGDPETGIVDVPGARLAVIRLADGTKLGLRQSLPTAW